VSARQVGACALLLAVLACAEPKSEARPPAVEAPKDSLALTAPGGVEVWYIGARTGRDSTGGTCVERSMEIRRDGTTTLIPLLYTGEAPTLANDSTLRTNLWLNCRPMRRYEVNLRTGRPVPK
jgi:hypothetical protein